MLTVLLDRSELVYTTSLDEECPSKLTGEDVKGAVTLVTEVVDNLGEEEAACKETTALELVTFSVG